MSFIKIFSPLFILLIALSGGCVTRVETLEPPHPEPMPGERTQNPAAVGAKPVTDKRVVIDPAMQNIIRVLKVTASTGSSGFLKIQINVQNVTDTIQSLSYKFDWFEADGTPLPLVDAAPMPWTLLKRETSFLALSAPTPSARNFKVTFLGPPHP